MDNLLVCSCPNTTRLKFVLFKFIALYLLLALHAESYKKLSLKTLLRDPNSHSNRLRRLGISTRTAGTSGHFVQATSSSLLACVKIIRDRDFTSGSEHIGSGRFATCYLRTLCHYEVCIKQFKHADNHSLSMKPIFCRSSCMPICHSFLVCVLVLILQL